MSNYTVSAEGAAAAASAAAAADLRDAANLSARTRKKACSARMRRFDERAAMAGDETAATTAGARSSQLEKSIASPKMSRARAASGQTASSSAAVAVRGTGEIQEGGFTAA